MATLVLQAAGAAVGGLFGPIGALVGGALGAVAGAAVDQRLFAGPAASGPQLGGVAFQGGAEGTALPRVYGRMRLSGTVIWATQFTETATTASGGKGAASAGATSYSYAANFAVAICEGPVTRIGRIWADGKPLDRATVNVRLHHGDEGQGADVLPVFYQGHAPAYRGTAYAVFQNLPLADYGNRLPQLSFEVIRVVDDLEPMIRAVTLIPGATEFGYHPAPVVTTWRFGGGTAMNRHVASDLTDIEASLDELQAVCPRLERVALVAGWFGDDLRAGACTLRPKVETRERATLGADWVVSGLSRADALEVSRTDGSSNYGGTPSDETVIAAIRAIRARGLKVTLYPFVLMDVPGGNGLPDPYGGGEQAAFPWRGRITVHPARGRAGSPDGTAAAAGQVAAFVGTAARTAFAPDTATVRYTGAEEWSLRRMVLHYAHLSVLAGGVDAFVIASEMRGLSTARSARTRFPFVEALTALAADVRAVVGAGPVVTYAADWSEFTTYRPEDGSGDVFFHLDPLWASAAIDAIGLDAYWPLADWRDGDHPDGAVAGSTYDLGYLAANVAGGEGYDWYYAGDADRAAAVRTPITDGAHGKPWVFRYKDIAQWWMNHHFERTGGTENAEATGWEPGSKPIWFTEIGCPAIDRGANQPNVFVDPKSAESAVPYFSSGARDDAIQRRYLQALIGHFDPDAPGFDAGANPVHPATGKRMVDVGAMHVWTWDARPFPAFPALTDIWADGPNWERGHWLTGRLGSTSLAGLVKAIFADHGFSDVAIDGLETVVDGYLVDRPMSLRDAVVPLADAFRFVLADGGDRVLVRGLDRTPAAMLGDDDLVETGSDGEPAVAWTRTQDCELPAEVRFAYLDSGRDLQAGAASARRAIATNRRVETVDLAAAMQEGVARRAAEIRLHDAWTARDRVTLRLPPGLMALEPGDVIAVTARGAGREAVIEEIEDADHRRVTARALDRRVLRGGGDAAPGAGGWATATPAGRGPPAVAILDLPILQEAVAAQRPWIAATATPWLGALAVMRAVGGSGFSEVARIERAAVFGFLTDAVGPGPVGRWDRGTAIRMDTSGPLSSLSPAQVLAGGNVLAIRSAAGTWEVLQFTTATLVGSGRYELSGLLRAQIGTEDAMAAGHLAGALAVLLDDRLAALPMERGEIGRSFDYRVMSPSVPLDDPAVTALSAMATGRGLRPLSPVHLRGRRDDATGDVTLSWIRRTRIGGDDWGGADVPLGEESELYTVEIREAAGMPVRRRFSATAPRVVYTAALQITDFGAVPAGFRFSVAQVAAGSGAGIPRGETFHG